MENLGSTYSKNLNKNLSRSWDVRVAEMTGNLNAALLYGQIAHHHKYMGDFSKSDQELSQELNLPLRTTKRMKSLLIEEGFISICNGYKNKTVYSIVKKLDYCEKSYRRYDINHCLINKDINSGVLLSYLIYCHKYFSQKGHTEFFKTNESLMKEVFLSSWQLNEAKKKLMTNGFIMTRTGQYGRTYYTINMERIRKAEEPYSHDLSSAKTSRAAVPKPAAQQCQNQPRSSAKTRHIIYKEDINNNYLGNKSIKPIGIHCESGLDRQIKEKEIIKDEQPMKVLSHPKGTRKVIEKPSVVLWTNPSYKPKYNYVELPEGNVEVNQSATKGVEKMENDDDIIKMIDIWNQTIKKNFGNILTTSQSVRENMREILEKKFDNSFDTWKEYCIQISLDDFRMGKKIGNTGGTFDVNLAWALRDDSIDNILLKMMERKSSGKTQKNLTPPKEELIKEVLSSSDEEWLKKMKSVLIEYMNHERGINGLQSYQSYLRNATFEVSLNDNKKKLLIISSYNAYNGLFIYNDLITKAFQDFDDITIFDGATDKKGSSLYMERKSTTVPENTYIWDRVCLENDIQNNAPKEIACSL